MIIPYTRVSSKNRSFSIIALVLSIIVMISSLCTQFAVDRTNSTGGQPSNTLVSNTSMPSDNGGGNPLNNSGGMTTNTVKKFNTVENTTSLLYNRDFQAINTHRFNVTTPNNWTLDDQKVSLTPYTKIQKVMDPTFSQPYGKEWESVIQARGTGAITQTFLPNATNPQNVQTSIKALNYSSDNPAFKSGDYGYYHQKSPILNPSNFLVQQGRLFQPQSQNETYWGNPNPHFYTDLNAPYGGVNRPNDEISLIYDNSTHSLVVNMLPGTTVLGGNPSAAWWYSITIPYAVDYAFFRIAWSIDSSSSFNASNLYQVRARINDAYIDGRSASHGGMLTYQNDSFTSAQLPADKTALAVYNGTIFHHGYIMRTYNITKLVNGLVGANKFDFGVWCKSPTHNGVPNPILARFNLANIGYNTSNKYEVARLDFDYTAYNLTSTGTGGPVPYAQLFANKASIGIYVKSALLGGYFIRILPFNSMVTGSIISVQRHVSFSLPQQYIPLLEQNNLNFSFGVLFEKDWYAPVNLQITFDNVYFTINYALPSVTSPAQIQMQVDSNPFMNLTSTTILLNTINWSKGQDHYFRFQTTNSTYNSSLYLNIISQYDGHIFGTNTAYARYTILTANSARGTWLVAYNNTWTYNLLLLKNVTGKFNISSYSISYLNMPAFDKHGSLSKNWQFYAAYNPRFVNYTSSSVRFNYTSNSSLQSGRINQALSSGNWTINAWQSNYITGCILNNTMTYSGLPAIYKGKTLKYNLTLLLNSKSDLTLSVHGNYSVTLNNSESKASGFPLYRTTSGQSAVGTIPILATYAAEKYYLEFYWNDTGAVRGTAQRFGSLLTSFNVINATNATFVSTIGTVAPGEIANFTMRYQTNDTKPVIGASITIYDNTTGVPVKWGIPWNGTYQVHNQDLGNGNYLIHLYTSGATNGTKKVIFSLSKSYNEGWNKTWNLVINSIKAINVTVTAGATLSGGKYTIIPSNVPYVNDTINSHVQLYLTDLVSHVALQNGLVIGHIGSTGVFFTALEIFLVTHNPADKGYYNITLNTMGLNTTSNTTLFITCSDSSYITKSINMTTAINPIPMTTALNNIQPVYEGGTVTLLATLDTLINHAAPSPFNFGTLHYSVRNGSGLIRTGLLYILVSGVYTNTVFLADMVSGNYTVTVNSTARNCVNSNSNNVSLIILPRLGTSISVSLPSTIRFLNSFVIGASLGYSANSTMLPNETVYLTIEIGGMTSLKVTGTTDNYGTIVYNYIVDRSTVGEQFNVTASFNGATTLAPCDDTDSAIVQGLIPMNMSIVPRPTSLRIGYPATYGLQIAITDPSESNLIRPITFIAWYNGQVYTPFITQQLYTDDSGVTSYTIGEIANGMKNITVLFEFAGSQTEAYANISIEQDILPKWTSSFNYSISPAVSNIHFGQNITFALNLTDGENTTIPLENLPVTFTLQYLKNQILTSETYAAYLNSNGTTSLVITIPDNFDVSFNGTGSLTVSIFFGGTNQIQNASRSHQLTIHPKIQVELEFITAIKSSYLSGEYYFLVNVTDSATGKPIQGLTIVFTYLDQIIYLPTNANGTVGTVLKFNQVISGGVITVTFVEEGEYAGASITSSSFNVIDQFTYFVQNYLPFIAMITGVVVIAAFAVYRGYVIPKRRRTRASLRQMYSRLSDIENIAYILVLNKGGIPMFSKSLAEVPIDESLVSGFLSAISSFGTEISTKMKKGEGGLEELSYQQFKIILDEGQYVRVALLLLRRPSDTLKARLKLFTQAFEKEFHDSVANFKGEVLQDMTVTPVIERVLEADLLYPHRVIEPKVKPYVKELKKKDVTKKVLKVATSDEFDSIFYVRELINNLKTSIGVEEIHSFDSIQKLKNDQVVFAINPRTNYIIDQLKPYIKAMTLDDRYTLFAISENNTDGMSMQKYFNKNKYVVTTDLSTTLMRLKSMHVIDADNNINSTGSAIVTLLRLIPDL